VHGHAIGVHDLLLGGPVVIHDEDEVEAPELDRVRAGWSSRQDQGHHGQ
jgi:hypothetical protein